MILAWDRDKIVTQVFLQLAGNDLNEDTTPIEASLKWTIGKRRQEKFDFVGGDAIRQQIQQGIKRRRVGILSEGAPARAGAPITLPDGTQVRTDRAVKLYLTGWLSWMYEQCIGYRWER